ncbi:MAG: hypothetical protein QOE84_1073 [Actinomycetota bacterium]|nr:hypothetical protein [Actinomycetota bacterium]
MERRSRWAALMGALAVTTCLGGLPGPAAADDGPRAWSFAAYGDSPYGTSPTDTAQFEASPAFIDSINADPDVSLVTHVGDIHSGKQYCTEAYDRSIAQLWTRFADSLVYTPGDNEWSDCHKPAEGGHVRDASGQPVDYADGDPLDNLALVRSLFFAKPGETLGGGNLHVQSQARVYDRAHPEDAAYVENVMWQRKDVLFVTVNIPGGSNNDTDPWFGSPSDRQTNEVRLRTAADLRWIDAAFARAHEDGSRAVVVVSQADMWDNEKGAAHLTEYEPFVRSLADHTTALGKPVLMFNGDSHLYRSDNPLSPSAPCVTEDTNGSEVPCASTAGNHPGYDVPNFHRIVVHGSTSPLEWLKVTVAQSDRSAGPNTFGPFTWARHRT